MENARQRRKERGRGVPGNNDKEEARKSAKQSEKKHQGEAGMNHFMGSVNTLLGASMWSLLLLFHQHELHHVPCTGGGEKYQGRRQGDSWHAYQVWCSLGTADFPDADSPNQEVILEPPSVFSLILSHLISSPIKDNSIYKNYY